MSRFNFTPVVKTNTPRYRSTPPPRRDAVRLTTKNLYVGGAIMRKFVKGRNVAASFVIEKDVTNGALKLTQVPKTTAEAFRICMGKNRSDLHTVRPVALADMPNGNYVQDPWSPGVYVLEG